MSEPDVDKIVSSYVSEVRERGTEEAHRIANTIEEHMRAVRAEARRWYLEPEQPPQKPDNQSL